MLLQARAAGGRPDHPPRATLLLEAGDPITGATPLLQEDTTHTGGGNPLQTQTGPVKADTTRGIAAGAEAGAPGLPGLPGQGRQ